MSYFPENLSLLRRRAGYTQESLAEALNVSRQAVSKWESGQTMPEADKLLALADLLGCTLDQLMREAPARESRAGADVPGTVASGPESEGPVLYDAYVRHMNRFACMMAGGVSLVLLGVAFVFVCYQLIGESVLITLPLFACLGAAVFLFVSGGISHGDFQRSYPEIPDCCDPKERAQFQRLFRTGIAGAVAGLLADAALLVTLTALGPADRAVVWAAALFFVILAFCVGTLVLLGVLHSKYDLEEYARAAGPDKGRDWGSAIMLAATALFLLAGFLLDLWHIAWVVFPIGGILCAIVDTLRKK